MPKHLTTLLLLCFISVSSYAQIIFEKGYLINSSNKKVECLIKNEDWKNNPSAFEYKLSTNDKAQTANYHSVKEFGVYGTSRYVSTKILMDKSSDNLSKLSNQREPTFEEDSIFLEVIVEGKATLYYYEEGNLKRYFYKLDDNEIRQLVYRRYNIKDSDYSSEKITANNYFRQQLYIDFKCDDFNSQSINNLTYTERDLKKIFIKYNTCSNTPFKVFESTKNRDQFNLTIRPGLNFSRLVVTNSEGSERDLEFDSRLNYRFGIEAEIILPYNQNKWSIFIEPTYQYFKSAAYKDVSIISGGGLNAAIDYSSIEVPFGVRHYFYLNNSMIFTNLALILDFNAKTQIEYTRNDGSPLYNIDLSTFGNLAFGLGYKYKERLSSELRINSNRNIVKDYITWHSKYSTISLIIGFTLF